MSPTLLYLVRHGEIEARYQRTFGGRIDMELSERGHHQAALLARHLEGVKFAAIYASPMRRVQQTLAPLLRNGAPPPVTLPDLREMDFGDWTGCGWEEVRARFGVSPYDWLHQVEAGLIPNAESGPALRARLEPCLERILAAHSGQRVAVYCHGGVIRVLLALLLELPLPKMLCFEVDYASVTLVESRPGRAEVQLLNFAPWRELAACAG